MYFLCPTCLTRDRTVTLVPKKEAGRDCPRCKEPSEDVLTSGEVRRVIRSWYQK